MKWFLATILLCLAIPAIGFAQEYDFTDTNPRVWTDLDGEKELTAKLIAYNLADGEVVLQGDDETKVEMKVKELSMDGRRYLSRQVKKAVRLAKRVNHSTRKAVKNAVNDKALESEELVLNTSQASSVRPDSDDIQRLYNVSWHTAPDSATTVAKSKEGVQDDKPIMWFRVLGDLSGYM